MKLYRGVCLKSLLRRVSGCTSFTLRHSPFDFACSVQNVMQCLCQERAQAAETWGKEPVGTSGGAESDHSN